MPKNTNFKRVLAFYGFTITNFADLIGRSRQNASRKVFDENVLSFADLRKLAQAKKTTITEVVKKIEEIENEE